MSKGRVQPTVGTGVSRRGGGSRRASGRVIPGAPYAAAVEFGHLAGAVRAHAGFRYVIPGAYTLGALAATRAARAARRGRRRS